ncbi:MAG: [NiFe]-hydrogenase assembly chaperone HybE [Gammaproteobacteria bacterium]|nr:[NiFe]-hydrogenase assembly chaperone HybE [Gammaproteobacteria bacterium]
MSTGHWQVIPPELEDDGALIAAFLEEFQRTYQASFEGASEVNHQLPIITHAFRQLGEWRVFLLLTPWMLARVFVPNRDPGVSVPAEWRASVRQGRPYRVIGPGCDLDLLSGRQRAHLNFAPRIGHYLIHPLILSMLEFQTAEQVFAAWNRVIVTRNDNIKRLGRTNPQQEEISRREFFSAVSKR